MNDTHDSKKQSAFGDVNPFLKLNKKTFPDQKRKNNNSKPGTAAFTKTQSHAGPDEDASMFLRAVDGVAPLGNAVPKAHDKYEDTTWTSMADVVELPKKLPKKTRKTTTVKAASTSSQPVTSGVLSEEEELGVFATAMRNVMPLAGKGRELPVQAVPSKPVIIQDDTTMEDVFKDKLEFATHHTDEYVEGHVLGLDLITVAKLQAGQFSPEAHLDFHGLNALQAYQRLVGFMRNAYMRNQRTVLLVPGRGRNSPNGVPVLRDKVQTWLTQEPFRRVVLAFCTAQPADGGAGALYVLLRKFRKDQGKVHWDRVPVDPDLLMD